jgi:hypothetical protein
MKRCRPWLLVGFVLAILLILGLRPDRPTRVSFDSLIGRASYPDLSQLRILRIKPAKFSLQLEARWSRAGPDECLPLLANLSLDHAPLRADDTGPPWNDPEGLRVLVRTTAVEVARPDGPDGGPTKGGNYPPNPAKTGTPTRIGVLQRVTFLL